MHPTQHGSATYDNPSSGSNSSLVPGDDQFNLEPTYELAAGSKTGTMESTSEL